MEKRFYNLLQIISVGILYIMSLLVFLNVCSRYFLKISITSTEELARFCFIWLTFIGATVALKNGEHLSIDILKGKISEKNEKYIGLFSSLVILVVCVLLVIGGVMIVKSGFDVYSPSLEIPYAYVQMIIPLMFLVMALIQIKKIFKEIKNLCFFEGER